MKRKCPGILALLGLLVPGSFCQTAALKGRIWEPIVQHGIVGADVILTRADKSVTRGISGDGGIYVFYGLKLGEHVLVTCRRNKYIPDPRPPDEVRLAQAATDHDLTLFENSANPPYWSAFAAVLKTNVERIAPTAQDAASYYERTWAAFAPYGFSAEARAVAARAILPLIPITTGAQYRRMALFAAADPAELAKAQGEIQSVVQGTGHLSIGKRSIAPELEYEIAVLEISKSKSVTSQARLYDELSTSWGIDEPKRKEYSLEMKNYPPIDENVLPRLEMIPKRKVEAKPMKTRPQ
jgi:hypothetical protein